MSTGARRAEAQPEDGTADTSQNWDVQSATRDFIGTESWPEGLPDAAPEERPARARAIAALLAVLALAWTAAAIWSIAATSPALTLPNVLQWLAFVSPPLILLGIAWLILGQTPRRETERFRKAIAAMRSESSALESVLAIVATRLEENHSKLRNEASKLMSLGDEASDRLGRVAYYLSKESANLDKKSEALESAAENARVDIGVLLQDLPRAEEQARSVAEAMKEAGLTAHSQAGALESQLSALVARGREADEVVGGAAQRLGANLARVESTAAAATARLEEAGASMTAAVDGTMARAADGMEAARAGMDAQGAAMLALVEQSRTTLERAGDDAARSLSQRLEQISGKIESLAGHLAAQDAASHALLNGLSTELAEVETRFAELRETGLGGAGQLNESFGAVRGTAQELFRELGDGQERARQLIGRAEEMAQALTGISAQLNGDVPAALGRVEEQAGRAHTALAAVAPTVAAMERSARSAGDKLVEAENSIARQHELLEASGSALTTYLTARLGEVEQKLAALRELGGTSTIELGDAIAGLRGSVGDLAESLEGGSDRAEALSGRAREIGAALAGIAAELDERVPAALRQVEEQAARTGGVAAELAPRVEAIRASADGAAARLAEAEASLARQEEALGVLLARLGEGVSGAEAQLRALGAAAGEADAAATHIAAETGPALVEALLRVRETAHQAAERAREAIASIVPQSAAALGQASSQALTGAVSGAVEAKLGELRQVAERATEAARQASERLTRQMLKIGETAAAVEARIDDARKEREERDAETFSRRVALLIESLNSTAIDVTKILSNEVTDSAWAAYLKGDRGVFTRRAVRLLDNSEARAIMQHYESEPEFREQVNRYVHDFEAMLRRILADRDSSALGVTVLSSDMGKLYVALAQAIERLR